MANLLDLPDELLLEIGMSIDAFGLRRLSLTCRRLRHVGQEALIRTAVLPPRNIWNLTDTLRTRPDLANAYTHLQLGKLNQSAHDAIAKSFAGFSECLSYESWSDYREILTHTHPVGNDTERLLNPTTVDEYLSVGLAILIALAPRLKGLSVDTNAIDCVSTLSKTFRNKGGLHGPPTLGEGWQELVKGRLEAQLRLLEVDTSEHILFKTSLAVNGGVGHEKCYEEMYLDLARFRQLEQVALPYWRIASEPRSFDWNGMGSTRSYHEYSKPGKLLPASLRLFRLDFVGYGAHFIPTWIDTVFCDLPNIRHVEVRFEQNVLSTAWGMCGVAKIGEESLMTLRRWQASEISFATTFGTIKLRDVFKVPSSTFVLGDLTIAVERCLATTHERLEQDPEMMAALGYARRISSDGK